MAEELQRYNSQGVGLRVPKVDFTASKVQAQTMASLSQSLDRMSSYFFRVAEGQAKIQGAEYGAENAPTKEQIEASIESGEPLEVVGDQTTVFGQYARNASLTAVTDEIDYMMSTEMSKTIKAFNNSLDNPVSDPNFEPTELLDKLTAIIEGHSSALDDVSPGTARKLRASGGIKANAKYVTYADKWSDNEFKKAKSKFFADIEEENLSLYDEISAFANDPKILDNHIKSLKIKRLNKASTFKFSQSEIKNISANFDANLQTLATKIINDEIIKADANEPGALVEKLINDPLTNELPDGLKAGFNILESLDLSRRDIINTLLSENRSRINDNNAKENALIEDNQAEIKDALASAYTLWFGGDTTNAEVIMNEFVNANGRPLNKGTAEFVEEWEKFKNTQSKVDVKDNDDVLVALKAKGSNLTIAEIVDAFNNDQLSKTTTASLIDEAEAYRDKDFNNAVTSIRLSLGLLEDVNIIDPDDELNMDMKLFADARNKLLRLYQKAKTENKLDQFDVFAEADKIIENVQNDLKPKVVVQEKNSVISTILRNVKILPNEIKSTFDGIKTGKADTLTSDNVQDMIDILFQIQSNINSNEKPSRKSGLQPLYNNYKDNTRKLDRDLEKLEKAMELF